MAQRRGLLLPQQLIRLQSASLTLLFLLLALRDSNATSYATSHTSSSPSGFSLLLKRLKLLLAQSRRLGSAAIASM